MTDTPRGRTFTNYLLLSDAQRRKVFLAPEGDAWSLPHWEERSARSWGSAADVNRAARDLLGLEVTTLRTLPHDPSPDHIVRVFEMENHAPDTRPLPEGRWVSRRDLDSLLFALPDHRGLLASWFAECEAGAPPGRAPWSRPGWFDSAAHWMTAQASVLGRHPSGPVVQERAWSISSVLRLPTAEGDLYLKACAALFAQEPLITRYLARQFPGQVPEVLAVEPERSWVLMAEMGGERLERLSAMEPWEQAVRQIARMQLECVDRVEALLDVGFADRRLERLAGQIDPLFDYAASATGRGALTEAERHGLFRIAPELKAACEALAASGLPETLEHGDCHPGNMVQRDGRIIIFDWSDGCVAHPFLTLLPFLTFRTFTQAPEVRGRLVERYLEAWTDVAPIDRLRAAYELSRPLAALHQAVAYWRILTHVGEEARWEWEADLPFFLRLLLTAPA